MKRKSLLFLATAAVAMLALPGTARPASHSDAPLIKQDPQANLTDVYAFIGTRYDNPSAKVLNVIVHVRPFSEPGDGVMYDRFADDALYSIHIANPSTGETLRRYDFRFSPVTSGYKNLDTILSYGRGTEIGAIADVGDARQNYTQTYSVTKVGGGSTVIGAGLLTPPPNVGARTTPFYNDASGRAVSGAASFAELDKYTQQTIYSLPTGEAVFAGPREDGFFADTPGIFDLLDPRHSRDEPGSSLRRRGRVQGLQRPRFRPADPRLGPSRPVVSEPLLRGPDGRGRVRLGFPAARHRPRQ
jgi:hypothetical protein